MNRWEKYTSLAMAMAFVLVGSVIAFVFHANFWLWWFGLSFFVFGTYEALDTLRKW